MRVVARTLVGLSGLIVLYLLVGTLGGLVPGRVADLPGGRDNTILLVPGPIHTDILMPLTDEVAEHFAFVEVTGVPVRHPMGEWLAVGWGAREFYTTVGGYEDVSARAVWRAISGDAAVMRFEVWGRIPDNHGLTEIQLSASQFDALIGAINETLVVDGLVVPLDHPGFGEADGFFAASGRFSLLRTCNAWVGEVLRAAGVRAGIWTPFTWSLP